MGEQGRITALLLAGRRPGVDPLAAHFGVPDKAMIPVAGETMLARVARTLRSYRGIGRILVLTEEPDVLRAGLGADADGLDFESGGSGSVSAAAAAALARHPANFPFLVVTADNPLLDHTTLDAFLAEARGADLAAGLVERRTLLASYPQSRRTWLKFRGGAYSGANLFWLASPKVAGALALWRTIEQQRKRGRAVIRAFGPLMLAGVGLRLLTLQRAFALAGRRFGLDARAVVLPIAEACIDVDSVADHALVSEIFARRALR